MLKGRRWRAGPFACPVGRSLERRDDLDRAVEVAAAEPHLRLGRRVVLEARGAADVHRLENLDGARALRVDVDLDLGVVRRAPAALAGRGRGADLEPLRMKPLHNLIQVEGLDPLHLVSLYHRAIAADWGAFRAFRRGAGRGWSARARAAGRGGPRPRE